MQAPRETSTSVFHPDVTVAAVVAREGRFLMVEETIRGQAVLNQPAGHLEPGESLLDATIRECREETAWEIQPECFIGSYLWQVPDSDRHFLRFAFAAKPLRHLPDQDLDEGILRAVWLNRDELVREAPRLRSPLVMRVIDDYLAGQRFPLSAVQHLA